MPGYAGQIKAKDRWAIVAYVRALQLSRNASIDSFPEEERESLLDEQKQIEQKLKEQAEAEQQSLRQAKRPRKDTSVLGDCSR